MARAATALRVVACIIEPSPSERSLIALRRTVAGNDLTTGSGYQLNRPIWVDCQVHRSVVVVEESPSLILVTHGNAPVRPCTLGVVAFVEKDNRALPGNDHSRVAPCQEIVRPDGAASADRKAHRSDLIRVVQDRSERPTRIRVVQCLDRPYGLTVRQQRVLPSGKTAERSRSPVVPFRA